MVTLKDLHEDLLCWWKNVTFFQNRSSGETKADLFIFFPCVKFCPQNSEAAFYVAFYLSWKMLSLSVPYHSSDYRFNKRRKEDILHQHLWVLEV